MKSVADELDNWLGVVEAALHMPGTRFIATNFHRVFDFGVRQRDWVGCLCIT